MMPLLLLILICAFTGLGHGKAWTASWQL